MIVILLSSFLKSMFDFKSFWTVLEEIVREEQTFLRKMKVIVMTAILTFSCSVIAEAGIYNSAEQGGELSDDLNETQFSVADFETIMNDVPFPFMEVLNGSIPHIYPPLEYLQDVPETYVVMEGDNLFRIAVNHGLSLLQLKSLNELEGDLIHPGEVLTVSGDEVDQNAVMSDPVTVAALTPETVPKDPPTETVFQSSIATPPANEGTEMYVTATAYTAYCTGCSGTTAYGIDLRSNPDQKVIAVDPAIIPLGTKVWVEGYGEAIAGDTGGAIKGHKIDVFIPSYDNAMAWGVKKVKIKVLN